MLNAIVVATSSQSDDATLVFMIIFICIIVPMLMGPPR